MKNLLIKMIKEGVQIKIKYILLNIILIKLKIINLFVYDNKFKIY